ncbi:hypothetical protein [Asticcacaulis sp.]|uniref:hypothetical protein n=1 Tax=Asticcacaulis sp. TaxID=1872648 RepID=UPI003F7BA333
MRKTAFTVFLFGILGLAYASFSAYQSYKLPSRPVSDYRFLAECEKVPMPDNRFKGSPLECEARIRETDLLKQAPDLIKRNGDDLMVFYNGQPSAKLTPVVEGSQGCDSYSLQSLLPTHDSMTKRVFYLAKISCHSGEFESRFIIMPDGTRWDVSDASTSPDGRLIGIGSNGYPGDGFTLYEWPERKLIAHFNPSCRVVDWVGSTQLTVTCLHEIKPFGVKDGYFLAFDAMVKRDTHGNWTMHTIRWLNPRVMDYNRQGDVEYTPTFALLWPMTFKPDTKKAS